MDLFAITQTEEIRLRVAAELARSRLDAMRACAVALSRLTLRGLQLDMWGDPVKITARAPRRAGGARQQVETIPAGPLAASSVFALAAATPTLGHKLWRQPAAERAPVRIERDGDCVRLIRMLPQETEEWQERERARRARQKPPRPPKTAKTRGRKLLDLIGPGEDS